MEIRNLTTLDLWFAVRELDCNHWSQSGTPAQITGTALLPGQLRSWSLEERFPGRYNQMRFGIFFRNPDRSYSQFGEISYSTNDWGATGDVYDGERVRQTNTGTPISDTQICRRQLVGKDPNRWKSTEEFDWTDRDFRLTFYSDGDDIWAVQCARNPFHANTR